MRLMERDTQGQSRAATSAAQLWTLENNAVSQYVTSMMKLCLEAAGSRSEIGLRLAGSIHNG